MYYTSKITTFFRQRGYDSGGHGFEFPALIWAQLINKRLRQPATWATHDVVRSQGLWVHFFGNLNSLHRIFPCEKLYSSWAKWGHQSGTAIFPFIRPGNFGYEYSASYLKRVYKQMCLPFNYCLNSIFRERVAQKMAVSPWWPPRSVYFLENVAS